MATERDKQDKDMPQRNFQMECFCLLNLAGLLTIVSLVAASRLELYGLKFFQKAPWGKLHYI